MTFWLVLAVNSVTFGGLLFLLSAGFSLIFGLMRIPNLTHGSLFMLGAYIGATFVIGMLGVKMNFWLAALLATLAVGQRPTVARRLAPTATVISASIAACTHVTAHVVAMRRYITGADAPLLEYLGESTWTPPLLSPWTLLVGCVIVFVGWAGWLVLLATRQVQASEPSHPAATLGRLCTPASRSSSSTIGQPSTR